ncbi:hypothetical protein SAMN05518672_10889 [Chitinophaga sp. CF118]|uniref:hypothetical protein n=1 Tax=Chitinophaga sp. CF118 TaxID=1884367 RepID=UPI0008E3D489|nr:hypothetical protein [Chitinophaga sp. CF118]SFE60908.1 hypothetical protein SAMN05518672_10889 [Chitinophaga sp. CF118]
MSINTLTVKAQSKQEIASMQQQLKQLTAADQLVQQYLKTFDPLDYTVFSNQQWARFHEKVIFEEHELINLIRSG